jgi:hypothetical protein
MLSPFCYEIQPLLTNISEVFLKGLPLNYYYIFYRSSIFLFVYNVSRVQYKDLEVFCLHV